MAVDERLNFGIIVIDKPAGPTSFTVSQFVADTLKLKKASHLGTLDPKVTGVLPITLGRACKLAGFFIGHDKGYVGVLHTHTEQDVAALQTLIDTHFVGAITQTPPHKSAVKRAERTRVVHTWQILEAAANKKDFLFYCEVEGGTYIRKLCSDVGEYIGGAHMAELRRTKAGIFTEAMMHTLPAFVEAVAAYTKGDTNALYSMITPASTAVQQIMPVITVQKSALQALLTGKPLFIDDIIDCDAFMKLPSDALFAVFIDNRFIEVAHKIPASSGGVVAKPLFVYN